MFWDQNMVIVAHIVIRNQDQNETIGEHSPTLDYLAEAKIDRSKALCIIDILAMIALTLLSQG